MKCRNRREEVACARVSSGAEKLTKTMRHFAQEHKNEIFFLFCRFWQIKDM